MNGFFQTYEDIFETIEDAILKDRIIPSLILFFSAIDSFSALASLKGRSDRSTFKEWVKKWMIDRSPLPCDEMDIYSARCALLHQQISKSDLTIGGKAKEILYAWGSKKAETLQVLINNKGRADDTVAVKIEDLIGAFKKGMICCYNEIQEDSEKFNIFKEEAKKMFVLVKPPLQQ